MKVVELTKECCVEFLALNHLTYPKGGEVSRLVEIYLQQKNKEGTRVSTLIISKPHIDTS